MKNWIFRANIRHFLGKNFSFKESFSWVSKKKWCVTFAYRLPYNRDNNGFLKELTKSLNPTTGKHGNVFVVKNLNRDILDQNY